MIKCNIFGNQKYGTPIIGTVQPRISIVKPQQLVLIRCFSSSNEVKWIKGDYIIHKWPILIIQSAMANDSGKYHCQGLDHYNKDFLATATVIVASELYNE